MSTRRFSLAAGDQDVLVHTRTSPEMALAELIWNALDADATTVRVELRRQVPLGPIANVAVTDDGHGIGPHELDAAFGKHRTSPKRAKRTSPAGRPMHGRNGRGRFRSFAVASEARWQTWGENELGDVVGHEVRIRSDDVTNGTIRDIEAPEREIESRTGTRVLLRLTESQKAARIGDDSFRRALEAVIAPTLMAVTEASVHFDGEPLDPVSQIEQQAQPEVFADVSEYSHPDGTPAGDPVLEVIEWTTSAVPPRIYLCDAEGAALLDYAGKVPKVAGIDWSAYLRWEGFARDTVNEGDLQNARAMFADVIQPALEALEGYLAERSESLVGDDIHRWVEDGTYPYQNPPGTLLEEAEQEGFRELVAVSRKAVPTDKEQRRLALGMMQRTFKESPDDALHVIAEVKGLDPDAVREFRELLERTPLSRVVHASTAITNRIDFLVALDELLHGPELREAFLETDHLHRLIEKNPWVFGNEWALVRSEAGLTSVLREHLALLRPDEPVSVTASDVDGSRRRVDLLFAGGIAEHRRRRRLVVELKRASVELGIPERNQIEAYANALTKSPKFRGDVVHWDFWLLGTRIHPDIHDSVNRKDQPPGLYNEFELRNGSTYRIWVRSWSEVLTGTKEDIRFFQDEISYDPDVADALRGIRARYPDHVPPDSRIDSSL